MRVKNNFFLISFFAFIMCMSGVSPLYANNSGTPLKGSILQYTSENSLVGFSPERVYFVMGDQVIIEEFIGARRVIPLGEQLKNKKDETKTLIKPPKMGKVVYKNLWENIKLTYEAKNKHIAESFFTIDTGGDVSSIKLKYNASATIEKDGSLKFKLTNGHFSQSAPKAWQDIEGDRKYIEVAFVAQDKNTFGFKLGNYDKTHQVIIDPTYTSFYAWHTAYGGNTGGNGNQGSSISVDSASNIYVLGNSNGTTFNGPAGQAPLHAHSGGYDISILKLNSAGTYQWHTFLNVVGMPTNLVLDSAGNMYIAMTVSANFNGPGGQAPLNAWGGGWSIAILKLNSAGTYQWHTFLNVTNANIYASNIAVDTASNVYLTGFSLFTFNGPGGQAPLNAHGGSGSGFNVYIAKYSSAGTYQWHTFYGGGGNSYYGYGIAVDTASNVYVTTGTSASFNGPAGQAPLNAWGVSGSIAILKLNSAGTYQWHTFYGASAAASYECGIAVDSAANVYVSFSTASTFNGPTGQAPLNAFYVTIAGTYYNNAIIKLNSAGTYQWHTFYGDGYNYISNIAVDSAANVYVTGLIFSTFNGPGGQAPLNAHSASGVNYNSLILKLNSAGTYQWHTFLGGDSSVINHSYITSYFNSGQKIAVDSSYNVYITGGLYSAMSGPDGEESLNGLSNPTYLYYRIPILKLQTAVFPTPLVGGNIQQPITVEPAVVSTFAGTALNEGSVNGKGSSASFYYPAGIATDGVFLYTSEFGNHDIRKTIIPTSSTKVLLGSALLAGAVNGTGAAARFFSPVGVTTDGTNIYVADTYNHTIRKEVIATGVVTTIAGSAGRIGSVDGTGGAARFKMPFGVTTDGTNIYVADTYNHTIRKVVIATGVVTTLAGTAGTSGSVDGTGAAARFNLPTHLTTDGTNLYVSDTFNDTIRKVVIATGVVTTLAGSAGIAGSTDGTGGAARFSLPIGIATDGTNIYVSDFGNHIIRKVVIATGVVTTLAGVAGDPNSTDGSGGVGRFFAPIGLTTDGTNLYIVEFGNHTIRRISL